MRDWLFQMGREAIGVVLTAALTWVSHTVVRAVRDLNASFKKIRNIEQRLKAIDGKDPCDGE